MTHICSEITRHMRLFELIRQQNIGEQIAKAKAGNAQQITPVEGARIVTQAAQSLAH